ncbi:serine/threonine protein phosphatase PrpC [Ruminiclostridium sufflavum DSM 19573]|uniref:Serine/threonine protein phosphatase PrpC n=1 Tax=Ruminiclostridium sufflavum DSM 19573 TaxID=1121337 RepID=A0A318XP60_9FIRM|nr:LysM peptidoglycan-binding domain-containing protein [Ruminiclostridium sufflavum]PYG88835.1 serine/threonine protein phosphatase PrpC [Ruminiclostridium sufflavum DSM 19573]
MDGNIRLSATVISCMGNGTDKDDFYFNGSLSNCHSTKSIQCSFEKACDNFIFSVTDSMGTDNEETAGISAIREIKKYHENIKKQQFSLENISEKIYESIQLTSNLIYSKSAIAKQEAAVLTGFSSVIIDNNRVTIMNLGNNGAFLYNQGVQKEIFAKNDSRKNQKLKMLGISPNTADIYNDTEKILKLAEEESKTKIKISPCIELIEGDIFLICSDGLMNSISKGRIESVINSGLDSSKIASILFQEALKNGVEDSVTVMVIKVEEIKNIEYSPSSYRRPSQIDYDNETEELHPNKEKNIVNYILAFVCVIVISGVLFMGYLIIQNSNILASEKQSADTSQADSTAGLSDESAGRSTDEFTADEEADNSTAGITNQGKDDTSKQSSETDSGIQSNEDKQTDKDKDKDTGEDSSADETKGGKNDVKESAGQITEADNNKNADTEYDVHIVQAGETLSSISNKYYYNPNKYDVIIKFNNLKDENNLYVGQELKIPKAGK